jgi:hypothetical protein
MLNRYSKKFGFGIEKIRIRDGKNLDTGLRFWIRNTRIKNTGVADPDPGSGTFLTPKSGIQNRFFPDPGSQIHTFESLGTIFWVKIL